MGYSIADILKSASEVSGPKFGNETIQKALEEKKKLDVEKHTNLCIEFLGVVEQNVKRTVRELHRIREMEKKQKEVVKKLDAAARYFEATGNMLPFVYQMHGGKYFSNVQDYCRYNGMEVVEESQGYHLVPSDWVAPVSEE